MSFEIRNMTEADVPVVGELDRLAFSLPWPERSFQFEVSSNPASRCLVAEVDGRVVGVLVAWLLVDELHIATLATHPDFRRRGIAQALLAETLKRGAREGAISSFLEVRASNEAAQVLYRKFGYEATGLRRRYYRDNDEDAVLMTLEKMNIE